MIKKYLFEKDKLRKRVKRMKKLKKLMNIKV